MDREAVGGDGHFLWCSEPDRGQSHTLNKSFARASGPFLFWLNADDLLLPGTLDRVRACLAATGTVEWGDYCAHTVVAMENVKRDGIGECKRECGLYRGLQRE